MDMQSIIEQYGLALFLYATFVGFMQSLWVWIVASKYMLPKCDKIVASVLVVFILTVHDVFWSVASGIENINGFILGLEMVALLNSMYFVVKYLCRGDVLYNYIYIFAIEAYFQLVALLITFPVYLVIADFNMEQVGLFLDVPSLKNALHVLVMYCIIGIATKLLWDFMYKHKGKGFYVICLLLFFFTIGAPMFSGWRIICVAFPACIVILFISFRQHNQNEKHLREQFAFYKDLAEKQAHREKEISVIRHDIANHMNVMEEMQKNDEGQQLLKKLDKANRSMTGIPVLDCLIREKASVCEKEGIAFEREGGAIGETKITEYEFVSLFANLLDNAIEAAKETEEKAVKLAVEKQQGVLKITVSNSKRAEQKPLEDNFKTTKKDKKNHGIGNRIVRDIVEVHGGRITYHDEGTKMRVVVLMQE